MTNKCFPAREERSSILTKSVVISSSEFEPAKTNFKIKKNKQSMKEILEQRYGPSISIDTKRMKNFKAVLKGMQKRGKDIHG